MENPNKVDQFSNLLDSSSSTAKSGIISGAKYVSKGIEKSTDYIKNNTKAHEKPVDIKYLPQIEQASKTTSYVIDSSFKFLGKATHRAFDVAEKKWNSIPQSEFMEKLSENEKFQDGVTIGMSGAKAGMNILSGVSEGISIIKDSGAKATVDIVDHSYGKNAAKATSETMNIAQNILNVRGVIYFSGFASVSINEAMKIQEEINGEVKKLEMIFDLLANINI